MRNCCHRKERPIALSGSAALLAEGLASSRDSPASEGTGPFIRKGIYRFKTHR